MAVAPRLRRRLPRALVALPLAMLLGAACTGRPAVAWPADTPAGPESPPRPDRSPRSAGASPWVPLTVLALGPALRAGVDILETSRMARRLAQEMAAVQKRFEERRRALPPAPPTGGQASSCRDAARLVELTGDDFETAILRAGRATLEPLRAWAEAEIRRERRELEPCAAALAASRLAGPGFVARYASLSPPASPSLTASEAAAPPADLVSRVLDAVGAAIQRVFDIGRNNDLQVKVWLGSTPAQGAYVTLSSLSTPYRTNREVALVRGLYAYRVELQGHPAIQCAAEERKGLITSADVLWPSGDPRQGQLDGAPAVTGRLPPRPGSCAPFDFVRQAERDICCHFEDGRCAFEDRGSCTADAR